MSGSRQTQYKNMAFVPRLYGLNMKKMSYLEQRWKMQLNNGIEISQPCKQWSQCLSRQAVIGTGTK